VLLVLIIWLRSRSLFLRALATDEDFTFGLLFKAFLVVALWTNQQTNVVDTGILGDIDLLFYFGYVL
jgi:hypothetical protein